jgi:hypothetical protein
MTTSVSLTEARHQLGQAAPEDRELSQLFVDYISYLRDFRRTERHSSTTRAERDLVSSGKCCAEHGRLGADSQDFEQRAEQAQRATSDGYPLSEMWWRAQGFNFPLGAAIAD